MDFTLRLLAFYKFSCIFHHISINNIYQIEILVCRFNSNLWFVVFFVNLHSKRIEYESNEIINYNMCVCVCDVCFFFVIYRLIICCMAMYFLFHFSSLVCEFSFGLNILEWIIAKVRKKQKIGENIEHRHLLGCAMHIIYFVNSSSSSPI